MSYNFSDLKTKLQKALDHAAREIATLRTGRASVQILDPVSVEAYGSMMKVSEVASVSAPDASLLVVKPWDKSLLEAIEKGIATSGINLHPVVDGDMIRISIPALTEERRKEMVKLLSQKIEQARVMMRTIRTDIKREIESQEGSDNISEDDVKNDLDTLEKELKVYMDKLDEMMSSKETELMKV